MNHIVLGVVTLAVAIGAAFSMMRSARIHLNAEERRRFNVVRKRNWFFAPICLLLITIYLSVRYFLPHYHFGNVLFLWTGYNLMLWVKMRRVMGGFQRAYLPVNFQLNYIFSQIIYYTGLVAAMLILSQGNLL